MKTEREIAELIFDPFRQTNCRVGHVVMMRTFRFGVEMKLNPIEKEIYYCVLTGLINLQYVQYVEQPECLRLTEKGYNYIYDDEKIQKMKNVSWLLPLLENPNWNKAFQKFYDILGEDNNRYKLEWNNFFDWINIYNPDHPVSNDIQNSIMGTKVGQYEKAFELVQSLPNDNARMSFYLCAQEYCERSVLD
jgi:hypothetical protein